LLESAIAPRADRWSSNQTFIGTTTWQETQALIGKLLERGLQQDGDFERHLMAGRINSFYGARPNLKEFAPEGIEGELRRLHYDTANATFAPSMAALMKLVPVSQITYGTDYPYFGFGQIADLQKLGLSAGDLDAIGHENATRLIPRLRA
jgi:hypothetical protein